MAGGGRTFSSMSRRTGRCRSTGRKLFFLCGGRGVEGTLMYGGGGVDTIACSRLEVSGMIRSGALRR